MIILRFIGFDGKEVSNFRVQRLISVDGVEYPPSPPVPSLEELSNRVCMLEAVIAQVLGDASLPSQSPPESSSVVSS